MRLAYSALIAAAVLTLGAFCAPSLAFPDDREGLTDKQVMMLKAEARQRTKLPPLPFLQVDEVRTYPDPGTLALPEAALRWRTIFGVEYGKTVIGGDGPYGEWHYGGGFLAWMAFVAGEAGLLVFAGWRAWNDY